MSFLLDLALIFVISTTLFDVVHFMLHRWQRSRWAVLRMFSSWHQVHHDFLDKGMKVHPELAGRNFRAHLLPEYLTSIAGTALMAFWFDWIPVAMIIAVHTVLFVIRIYTEGVDTHHMATDRVSGQRGVWFVRPAYHALHHINPLAFYSSFLNVFDMLFGTAVAIRGKRVLLTGASGAYGSNMAAALKRLGAEVTPLSVRFNSIDQLTDLRLDQFDMLVMCHGLKESERADTVWTANFAFPMTLGENFIAANSSKLVPPEIWCVGSEAEAIGISDYAMSKRKMSDYAAQQWFHSPDVTYRHIVPSAFASPMGWGPMTAGFAVAVSLFLIRRGFRYIPVTYTGFAFLNRLRFVRWPRMLRPKAQRPAEEHP